MTAAPRTRVRVPARVHLAGNPSDGYGGAVLSTVVPEMSASVHAALSRRFSVVGPARSWASLDDLVADVAHHGHDDGDHLVIAALSALHRLLPADVARPPLAIDWDTDIPRSVGLAGSSAIVLATMRAALDAWGLQVPPHELAEAALVAEVEDLGIAGGIADRIAQVSERTVLTDCRSPVPAITPVSAINPVEALLVWSPDAAAPSGHYHGELRARFAGGDAESDRLRAAMAELARFAEDATVALTAGDLAGLRGAMDASLDARMALGPVPPAAVAPVAALRDAGASVNMAGSGGALVVVPATTPVPDGWRSRRIVIR